ncbi:MAG: hypothetical protein LBH43_13865 [Treponema sp.]|jgi:hypothetical protein|nr:hypothetical protein [Treponema sp.]
MKTFESIVIPTYADKKPRWRVRVDLSKHRYTMFVSYNTRQDAWVMNLSDVNGNLIIAGIRLVPGVSFFEKYRASCPELPPGKLILIDTEGRLNSAEVTRKNLSSRFALTYTVVKEE